MLIIAKLPLLQKSSTNLRDHRRSQGTVNIYECLTDFWNPIITTFLVSSLAIEWKTGIKIESRSVSGA